MSLLGIGFTVALGWFGIKHQNKLVCTVDHYTGAHIFINVTCDKSSKNLPPHPHHKHHQYLQGKLERVLVD